MIRSLFTFAVFTLSLLFANAFTPPDGFFRAFPGVTTADINDVAFGNDQFVAVGSAGWVGLSEDGESWEQ